MKEITVLALKTRYPRSYYDLLELLDVRAYNSKSLALAGIRSVQVFMSKRKRYYCYVRGMDSIAFGSVCWDLSSDNNHDDCYVLTIASSGTIEVSPPESSICSREGERLEYEVYLKGRKAEFANNTGNWGAASKEMTKLFLYCLQRMVDVDIISIRVFKEDAALVEELQAVGFEITNRDLGCVIVTKNNSEWVELPLLLE